jgi:hypothetical protein
MAGGGVWRKTAVEAESPSDPFLLTGFGRIALHMTADRAATFDLQVDFLGDGSWESCDKVKASGYKPLVFPAGFTAHWIRLVPDSRCLATAEFMFT